MLTTTKQCNTCNIIKPSSEFYKRKDRLNGLTSNCKSCAKARTASYFRTKIGVISKIYNSQKQSSKHRSHHLPTYTLNELREFLLSKELFHEIYDTWVGSGYMKMLVPSVDRIDDYKSYTIRNIQIMTWRENKNKYDIDKIHGVNKKSIVSVLQFSLDNKYISTYHSLAEAERITKIHHSNISNACQGKRNQAGGFKWKYS